MMKDRGNTVGSQLANTGQEGPASRIMAVIALQSGGAMGREVTISRVVAVWIVRSRRASMVKDGQHQVKRSSREGCQASGVAA